MGEIELDDGMWEVDDALAADRKEYDLKLSPTTLDIVKRELDRFSQAGEAAAASHHRPHGED